MLSNRINLNNSAVRPSWAQGFARGRGEAENQHLWDGLVGAWSPSLGATGLTLHDVSGRGNDGTLVNGPTWTTGSLGTALDFDHTADQRVTVDGSNIELISGLTVACWASLDSAGDAYGRFMDRVVTGQWSLYYNNNASYGLGFALATASGNVDRYDLGVQCVVYGEPFMVALTYDGVTAKLYYNGDLVYSSAIGLGGNLDASSANIEFGNRASDGARGIDGQIFQGGLWSRALSASEIAELYRDQDALIRPITKSYLFYQAPAVTSGHAGILHRGQIPGILSRAG